MNQTYGTATSSDIGAVEVGLILGMVCVGIAVALAVAAVICWLLYNLQTAVPAQHRKLEPPKVWLLLIPLFNLVWNFFVFQPIADSYGSYFASIGQPQKGETERQLGLWYSICAALSLVPCVNYISGPAALVLLIIYLVKMYGLKGELLASLANQTAVTTPPPAV